MEGGAYFKRPGKPFSCYLDTSKRGIRKESAFFVSSGSKSCLPITLKKKCKLKKMPGVLPGPNQVGVNCMFAQGGEKTMPERGSH